MRPIKQSNSMKELLKKLKRHDTLVLASGVVVASLLCGGFVYVTTPAISADAAQEEVRRDSLGVQKKASDQLKEIENYLERLDKVVTDNQELVKDIQTVQNEQKEITEKAIETQKTLETQKTTSTEKSTNNNSTQVVEKISGLDKALDSIHSEIKATNTQIKELKDSMDKGGEKNPDKDKENFSQITNALNDIKKSCEKSGTDVSGLVAELKSNKSTEVESQKTVINNLETIVKSLEKVETKENLTRMESELKSTQTTYINMLDNVEKNVAKTTDNVKKVGDKVGKVAENVSNMGNSISEMRKAQENSDSRISSIGNEIGNVKGEVGNVSAKVGDVTSKIGDVSSKVGDVTSKIGDVSSKVGDVTSKMGDVSNQVGDVSTQVGGISTQVGDVSTQVGGISTQVGDMNSKVVNVETLVGDVQGEIKKVNISIGDTNKKIDELTGQVQQVFQCSDSNRRKLASVLSDMGAYTAAEDATFDELIEAVKLIPTHVINVGAVSYEHHYHVDAKGNTVSDRSTTKGGCFTTPVYHAHTAACYKDEVVYVYVPNWNSIDKRYTSLRDNQYISCIKCGQKVYKDQVYTHTHETYDPAIAKDSLYYRQETRKKQTCPKSTGTVEYYVPGCGYTHGAITKAVVNYPKHLIKNNNAMNTLNTSMLSVSEGVEINEEIFNFDIPWDDETQGEEMQGEETYNEEENQGENPESEGDGTGAEENNEEENAEPQNADENGDQNRVPQVPEDNGGKQPESVPSISDGNSEG